MNGFGDIRKRWKNANSDILANPPPTGGGGVQNILYQQLRETIFSPRDIAMLAVNREEAFQRLIRDRELLR